MSGSYHNRHSHYDERNRNGHFDGGQGVPNSPVDSNRNQRDALYERLKVMQANHEDLHRVMKSDTPLLAGGGSLDRNNQKARFARTQHNSIENEMIQHQRSQEERINRERMRHQMKIQRETRKREDNAGVADIEYHDKNPSDLLPYTARSNQFVDAGSRINCGRCGGWREVDESEFGMKSIKSAIARGKSAVGGMVQKQIDKHATKPTEPPPAPTATDAPAQKVQGSANRVVQEVTWNNYREGKNNFQPVGNNCPEGQNNCRQMSFNCAPIPTTCTPINYPRDPIHCPQAPLPSINCPSNKINCPQAPLPSINCPSNKINCDTTPNSHAYNYPISHAYNYPNSHQNICAITHPNNCPITYPNTCAQPQNNCAQPQNNCAQPQNNCTQPQNNCAQTQNICAQPQNICQPRRANYLDTNSPIEESCWSLRQTSQVPMAGFC